MYDTSATAAKKVKPSNVAPSALLGAGWALIETQSASSSATIDFTNGLDDTFDAFEIRISNAKLATDDVEMWMRIGTGAGPTYQAGASAYYWQTDVLRGASSGIVGDVGDSEMVLSFTSAGAALGNASGENFNAVIGFNNPDASDFCEFHWRGSYSDASGIPTPFWGGGRYNTAGAITAIRFLPETGTFASGRFSLYGLKKS